MNSPLLVGIALVALFVLVRYFAARRVAARQGRFVWLLFAPTLVGAVVILWAGIQMLATVPLLGVAMLIAGGIYVALVLRFLTRVSRSVSAVGPRDDIGAALSESVADFVSTTIGLVLIGGLVALIGLILWGVSQAAR